MQKNGYRYQVWISVLLWLGLSLVISASQGQSGPMDDYPSVSWMSSQAGTLLASISPDTMK
jgi:hypothetical protein